MTPQLSLGVFGRVFWCLDEPKIRGTGRSTTNDSRCFFHLDVVKNQLFEL